ncbi:MAG: hypothetical protein KC416_13145, partial [Myxococcales bacterium]|nr:hypothetical protein [Myxococcales bacterium]
GPTPPLFPDAELGGLVPKDQREVYDAEQVVARLVDQSLFWEVMPDLGQEMICGVGRLGGLYAGIIINRQGLIDDPDKPGTKRPSGVLYRDGIAKISAFSRACDADGIPLIWLQDISGFDIGTDAERQGLLAYGSSLIYTNSTNETPMFTVLLRKASGAGYYAMSGLPYDPALQLSTPIARQSVMEGRTLAIATYNTKLDDDFAIVTQDPEERAEIEKGMIDVERRIEGDMDPYVAARQMDTDEIVAFGEIRERLSALVEMSYQATGYRRMKNPRIWSLHDLATLTRGRRAPMEAADAPTPSKAKAIADLGPGLFFRAPTSGRFYARPSPDAEPFVVPGQRIRKGDPAGLLEVMKTFNRLSITGDDLPDTLVVKRVIPDDGTDVDEGDPLLEFETP